MTKKYPRTSHVPISLGASSDDKIMTSLEGLAVDDLVISEKMDGENATQHYGGCHARRPYSRNQPSRDWLNAFTAGITPVATLWRGPWRAGLFETIAAGLDPDRHDDHIHIQL